MRFLTRKETIDILINNFGDLKCAQTYYQSEYTRTLSNCYESDRHIQMGMFEDNTKAKAKFLGSNILFFEIDDNQLKTDSKNWTNYIENHLNVIKKGMNEFLNKPFDCNPVIGTFSGSKSIHFLFKLDKYLSKGEYFKIQEGFHVVSNQVLQDMKKQAGITKSITHGELVKMNLTGLKYPNLSLLDLQIPFNSSSSPRIHCEIPQDNRLSQKSIYFEDFKEINTKDLLGRVEVILLKDKLMKANLKLNRPDNILPVSKGSWYSKETLEKILNKDLTQTNRDDKFLLTCPVHEDSNKSAFVTKSGFIYCSVCCTGGLKFAAKIIGGKVIVNKDLTSHMEE